MSPCLSWPSTAVIHCRICAFNLENITGAGMSVVLERCYKLHTLSFEAALHVMNGLKTQCFCNLLSLHLQWAERTRCQSILQHCVRLQQLRLNGFAVDVLGLTRLGSFNADNLPALRVLSVPRMLVNSSRRYATTLADFPDLAALQALRPKLRIVMESNASWNYDFIGLPV